MELEIGRLITYDNGNRNAIITYINEKEQWVFALCSDGVTHTFNYNEFVKTEVVVKSMDTIMYNLKYCRY